MQPMWKPLLVVLLVLAVPIVSFVLVGGRLEATFVEQAFRARENPAVLFAVIGIVLSTDVFLPVPSSGLATLAGAELGAVWGTAATWLGTTLGAVLGFFTARIAGRPLAKRLAGPEELGRLEAPAGRYGAWLLFITRPLPVVAEAMVLLLGTTRLPWHKFWWPVAIANLLLAILYATIGELSHRSGWLVPALVAALLLPLLATLIVRKWFFLKKG